MAEIKRDYYETLGVARNADATQIKRAYRKMALKYHPDHNQDDADAEEKFKEAAEAYEVLRDSEKRALYDRFGHDGLKQSGFSGFAGFEDIFSSFGDIFEDLFGFGSARSARAPRRGADLRYDMEVDFMEAVFGAEKEIEYERRSICRTCSGSGARPGTSPSRCSRCHGAGKIARSQGFFSVTTTCPQCRGAGSLIETPCKSCSGSGTAFSKVSRTVKIPAGVDTGSRLRLRGAGEESFSGGESGDLYVALFVKSHPLFERHDHTIVCDLSVSFPQAALGAELKIPTLDGETTFRVPPGSDSGSIHKLEGRGVPYLNSHGRGDMLLRLNVKTPKKLSADADRLIRELAEIEGDEVMPRQKGFFEKLIG